MNDKQTSREKPVTTMQDMIRKWWGWLQRGTDDQAKNQALAQVYSDGREYLYATNGYAMHFLQMEGIPKGVVTLKEEEQQAYFSVTETDTLPLPPLPRPEQAQLTFCLDVDLLRTALEVHGQGHV